MYSTYAEYLRHPRFRAVCKLVRQRSGGKCERCGRQAIDFHHVRYCRWGDFDTPDNLQHLCRECHEAAHTCLRCGGIMKSADIKRGGESCGRCRRRSK
jgi:hypothetical protein